MWFGASLHILLSNPPSLLETTTSKLASYMLKLASYSYSNLFATGTNINKLAAVAFSSAGI